MKGYRLEHVVDSAAGHYSCVNISYSHSYYLPAACCIKCHFKCFCLSHPVLPPFPEHLLLSFTLIVDVWFFLFASFLSNFVYFIYLCNPLSCGRIAPPFPLLLPSCPVVFPFFFLFYFLWCLWVCAGVASVCVRSFVVWLVTVFIKRSLLTFSVSRVPLREDPPPDIIPSRWAGRSVAPHSSNGGKQSYLAAASQTELSAFDVTAAKFSSIRSQTPETLMVLQACLVPRFRVEVRLWLSLIPVSRMA